MWPVVGWEPEGIGVVEGVVAFVLGGESAVSMSLVGGERCLCAMSASDTRAASLAGAHRYACYLAVVCGGPRQSRFFALGEFIELNGD